MKNKSNSYKKQIKNNKFSIDPYSLCPCGSGNKYKFCCYQKEDKEFINLAQLNQYLYKNVDKKISFCLARNEFEKCEGNIISSHSIQKNGILSKVSKNGLLYTVTTNKGELVIDLKGKNDATTSTCFCKYHDDKIFGPIEKGNYFIKTDEQYFLFAYRAFSKMYYEKLNELYTYQELFRLKPKYSVESYKHITISSVELGVKDNEELKNTFNKTLLNRNFNILNSICLKIDYKISFATSFVAPLEYDLDGNLLYNRFNSSEKPKNLFITIFPEINNSYILISWLKTDNNHYENFINQINKLYNTDKMKFIKMLNNFVVNNSDNFVIHPDLYDSWTEDVKKSFEEQFKDTTVFLKGQSIKKDLINYDCKFDLFKNIN